MIIKTQPFRQGRNKLYISSLNVIWIISLTCKELHIYFGIVIHEFLYSLSGWVVFVLYAKQNLELKYDTALHLRHEAFKNTCGSSFRATYVDDVIHHTNTCRVRPKWTLLQQNNRETHKKDSKMTFRSIKPEPQVFSRPNRNRVNSLGCFNWSCLAEDVLINNYWMRFL